MKIQRGIDVMKRIRLRRCPKCGKLPRKWTEHGFLHYCGCKACSTKCGSPIKRRAIEAWNARRNVMCEIEPGHWRAEAEHE